MGKSNKNWWHSLQEANIKGHFALFVTFLISVSDLFSLDWLILTLLISFTWTWSNCKSQVCACACACASARISGACCPVSVCVCVWLTPWLWLLWSLSKRPEGTDDIHPSISYLSVYFLLLSSLVFNLSPPFQQLSSYKLTTLWKFQKHYMGNKKKRILEFLGLINPPEHFWNTLTGNNLF